MVYSIEQLDKQIIIQKRLTTVADRDVIGGLPYDYEDYIVGDGNGVAAAFLDSTPTDMLTASQHNQLTTVTVITRYDSRISPSMRVKYWDGDDYEYFDISVVSDDLFQHRFCRILAQETKEEAPDS